MGRPRSSQSDPLPHRAVSGSPPPCLGTLTQPSRAGHPLLHRRPANARLNPNWKRTHMNRTAARGFQAARRGSTELTALCRSVPGCRRCTATAWFSWQAMWFRGPEWHEMGRVFGFAQLADGVVLPDCGALRPIFTRRGSSRGVFTAHAAPDAASSWRPPIPRRQRSRANLAHLLVPLPSRRAGARAPAARRPERRRLPR